MWSHWCWCKTKALKYLHNCAERGAVYLPRVRLLHAQPPLPSHLLPHRAPVVFYAELTPYPSPRRHVTQRHPVTVQRDTSGMALLSSGAARPAPAAGSRTCCREPHRPPDAATRTWGPAEASRTKNQTRPPEDSANVQSQLVLITRFSVGLFQCVLELRRPLNWVSFNWISGILCGNFPNTKTVREKHNTAGLEDGGKCPQAKDADSL